MTDIKMTDIKQHIAEHYDDSDIKLILDRSKPSGHINVASGVQIGFHVQRKRLRIQMICDNNPNAFKTWADEFLFTCMEGQRRLPSWEDGSLSVKFGDHGRQMTMKPGKRNTNWTRIEIMVPFTLDPATASEEDMTQQYVAMAFEGLDLMGKLRSKWVKHEKEFDDYVTADMISTDITREEQDEIGKALEAPQAISDFVFISG